MSEEPTIHDRIAALYAAAEAGDPTAYGRVDELVADRNEQVYYAATAAVDALDSFLYESGEHLTCGEIEAMARLYEALGQEVAFLDKESSHVAHDEEGDDHWQGDEVVDPCTRCGHSAEDHGGGPGEGEYPDQPCGECDCDRWTEEEQA